MARVIVTRPAGRAAPLVNELRRRGHDVVHVPLVEIEPIGDDPIPVDGYDWVVVTSAAGARELRKRMVGVPRRVAAVGPATAQAMGGADLVPAVSSQEGLLAELPRPAGRVLFAGAETARRLLPDALGADVVHLYRTKPLVPAARLDGDLVVLASASAAKAFGALRSAIPVVSIGPETTRAAEAAGADVRAEAARPDVDGLVDAVELALSTL